MMSRRTRQVEDLVKDWAWDEIGDPTDLALLTDQLDGVDADERDEQEVDLD